jgi:hypothetical protein
MKSAPKILVGWQLVVPEFGFGTVLSFAKQQGLRKKAPVCQIRFNTVGTSTEVIGLKLSLKNPETGKFSYKKGGLKWLRYPFVLVSAEGA